MAKIKKRELKKKAPGLIARLFSLAKKDKKKANDCVRKARNISMKINKPLESKYKRRFCKHCKTYFNSKNCRVRTRNKMLIYYCRECKKYSKYNFKHQ